MLKLCCKLCRPHTADRRRARKVRDSRPHGLIKGCFSDFKCHGSKVASGLTSGLFPTFLFSSTVAFFRWNLFFPHLLENWLITVQRLKDHRVPFWKELLETLKDDSEESAGDLSWCVFVWTDPGTAGSSFIAQRCLSTTRQSRRKVVSYLHWWIHSVRNSFTRSRNHSTCWEYF